MALVDPKELEKLFKQKQSTERDRKLFDMLMKLFDQVSSINSKLDVKTQTNVVVDTTAMEQILTRIEAVKQEVLLPPSLEAIWNAILKKLDKKVSKLVVNRHGDGTIKDLDVLYE